MLRSMLKSLLCGNVPEYSILSKLVDTGAKEVWDEAARKVQKNRIDQENLREEIPEYLKEHERRSLVLLQKLRLIHAEFRSLGELSGFNASQRRVLKYDLRDRHKMLMPEIKAMYDAVKGFSDEDRTFLVFSRKYPWAASIRKDDIFANWPPEVKYAEYIQLLEIWLKALDEQIDNYENVLNDA